MLTGKLLHLVNKYSKLTGNAINMKKEKLFHIPITSWEEVENNKQTKNSE